MTSSRDPFEVPAAGEPSLAELDESDRRLDQLSSDSSSDPVTALLRAASSAPSEDELEDRFGVAALVARTATPTAQLPPVAADTPGEDRRTHVRRVLTTKAAIIIGVTVLGLAGAGAATGVYRTATSPDDRPPATSDDVPSATVDGPAADPADRAGGTSNRPTAPLWPFLWWLVDPPVEPALPDDAGSADDRSPDVDSPDGHDDPGPGDTGATNGSSPTNGNSPNAGGNPNPGNNGATNGNSPNAGGNPDGSPR